MVLVGMKKKSGPNILNIYKNTDQNEDVCTRRMTLPIAPNHVILITKSIILV